MGEGVVVYLSEGIAMENSRLLLEINKKIQDVNQEEINPRFSELKLEDLEPVIEMVAKARADYLQEVFALANTVRGKQPSIDQIKHLRHLRLTFEELLSASGALETAIERGYLDVDG